MTDAEIIDCTTCKYGYEDERLGIPMCHHPKRFSEDCVNFNMHEEKETEESEKPMQEGLEEELDRFIASGKSVTVDDYGTYKVSYHDFKKVARHFAELGYLRAAEKYNEIEYNRQRAEEDTPNDLEEAADEHVNNIAYCGDDIEFEKEQSKRDFIAGADWQREQMMKGAVEGKIIFLLNGDVAINIGDIDEYKLGQKVRIIVKED